MESIKADIFEKFKFDELKHPEKVNGGRPDTWTITNGQVTCRDHYSSWWTKDNSGGHRDYGYQDHCLAPFNAGGGPIVKDSGSKKINF